MRSFRNFRVNQMLQRVSYRHIHFSRSAYEGKDLQENNRDSKGNSADWLLNLRSSVNNAPEKPEQNSVEDDFSAIDSSAADSSPDSLEPAVSADVVAQQWIDAMNSLRTKWKPDGTPFNVDKAFAPEGMDDDYDFWAAADAEIAMQGRSNQFTASPEQIAEAEALSQKPIPPRRDRWMNLLVNVVMRHGEKAKAHKTVNRALYLVFLKLRVDPVSKLLEALDCMAPLAQLHRIGDGGARVEVFPVPYSEMQRIGLAWKWVIEASNKRQSRDFSVRLGEEIIAAIEGKSPGFAKTEAIHKSAVANRSIAEEVHQGRWKR